VEKKGKRMMMKKRMKNEIKRTDRKRVRTERERERERVEKRESGM
jgi:hypothetical protein